jgi:hypothetical protein
VLDRQAEGYDVARIFSRERAYLSWNLHNPLRAPHDAARSTVVMEICIVVIILTTVLSNVAPWSTASLPVAGAFIAHYFFMMLFAMASPFNSLSLALAGAPPPTACPCSHAAVL